MRHSNNNKNSVNKNIVRQILDSLKLAIESKINKSFQNTFKNSAKKEINNWKNSIIKLILIEIDKIEIKFQQINKDLNQKESIESEDQNGKKAGFKSQIEDNNKSSLNQNKPSSCDKSHDYNNQNIDEKKKVTNHDINQKNNNQIIFITKPLPGSKHHQSNKQNMQNNYSKLDRKSNISQNQGLDFFTSEDIQEENKKITKIFQYEAQYYFYDEEEIKNENIGKFLIKVANVSRKAYNISNELFKNMFKKFSKIKEEEKNISNLKNDEQLTKEFSSWIKQYEKEPKGKKKYENYFNSFKDIFKYPKEKYLYTLLCQLTKLYFHCEVSFPIVDVDFNSEQIFNDEKMLDLINKGNNRKVNFLILPSLLSNGKYLQNGKSWVFTYKRNTFKFDRLSFQNLVNKYEKYISPNIDYIFNQFNGQNIEQNNQINDSKSLDFFIPKDIQEENKEFTRIFQKESLNYIDDDEKLENENIANFLIKVANISRKAYNNSNDLFKNMFKEFSKIKEEEKSISTLKYDEQLKKEFSSWVKQYEKKLEGKKKYENYFNSFEGLFKYPEEAYLYTFLCQLTKLYFHCELSFPIVDVDFNSNSEILFNHEKMIDFINKGNNRKVDFIILPSLLLNGNFLENGKFWVFTYKKDTFNFGKSIFESLVNKQDKYNEICSKNNYMNSQTNNENVKSKANISNKSNLNKKPKERETKNNKQPKSKTKISK